MTIDADVVANDICPSMLFLIKNWPVSRHPVGPHHSDNCLLKPALCEITSPFREKSVMPPQASKASVFAKKSNGNIAFVAHEKHLIDHILDWRTGNTIVMRVHRHREMSMSRAPRE
jgi:hypothetical protein